MNFVKFLRTPFLQNTSGQLLLNKHANKCEQNDMIDYNLSLFSPIKPGLF